MKTQCRGPAGPFAPLSALQLDGFFTLFSPRSRWSFLSPVAARHAAAGSTRFVVVCVCVFTASFFFLFFEP